jgi:hypothetical protein
MFIDIAMKRSSKRILGREERGGDTSLDRKTAPHALAAGGRTFSALELLCIMYAGFERIAPGMDIGVDLWRGVGDGGEAGGSGGCGF